MACTFCYRDTKAPSLLTREFLVDLLQKSERWGVLEVAFGGGEPLLFKGFVELIEELHQTTSLGLNFTTNGLLLKPDVMRRIEGKVGEIRLSAYPDNHWRQTLATLRGAPLAINWLVTPSTVREVGSQVREFIALGARNVLLLAPPIARCRRARSRTLVCPSRRLKTCGESTRS